MDTPTCDRCEQPIRYKITTKSAEPVYTADLIRLLCSAHGQESMTVLDLHHIPYTAEVIR